MKTLKQEEADRRSYSDAHQARNEIGAFIEEVYNRQRLHSALAYQSPESSTGNKSLPPWLPPGLECIAARVRKPWGEAITRNERAEKGERHADFHEWIAEDFNEHVVDMTYLAEQVAALARK